MNKGGFFVHKDIEKILYSEQDIKNIVKRLAKEIEKACLRAAYRLWLI